MADAARAASGEVVVRVREANRAGVDLPAQVDTRSHDVATLSSSSARSSSSTALALSASTPRPRRAMSRAGDALAAKPIVARSAWRRAASSRLASSASPPSSLLGLAAAGAELSVEMGEPLEVSAQSKALIGIGSVSR